MKLMELVMMIVIVVVLGVVIPLFTVSDALAQQEQTLTSAIPHTFNLAKNVRTYGITSVVFLREMRAVRTNLFFLMQNGREMLVARTDLGGHIELIVKLGAVEVIDWFVGPDEAITVDSESQDGNTHELRRYNNRGEFQQASETPRSTYGAEMLSHALVKITRSGAIVRNIDSQQITLGFLPLKHLNRFETTCLLLSQERAAIVDGVDATVTLLHLNTGASEVKVLVHPEVEGVKSKSLANAEDAHVLIVLAAASDADGNVYCMLSGFRTQQGAPVIVLDQRGELRTSFRCPIVRSENGPMIPTAISITNQDFFVAGQDGGVAHFHIPPFR